MYVCTQFSMYICFSKLIISDKFFKFTVQCGFFFKIF